LIPPPAIGYGAGGLAQRIQGGLAMRAVKGIAAALVVAALSWAPAQAHVGWSVGINLGAPLFYHPYWPQPYPYYYYRPYPVYVEPAAVVVEPAPVYHAVPVARPAYSSPAEALPTPAPASPSDAPPPLPTPVQTTGFAQDAVGPQLQLLNAGDDRGRADAAVQLGRLQARRAVQPLIQTLNGDRNAAVREAAARALGLIADPASLPALQRAAQADDDREVRHSAQFAAEVIRSNVPR
jgi:hypothetical protein